MENRNELGRFIKGHKIPNNIRGTHRSEESNKKAVETRRKNGSYGIEWRNKLSKNNKGKHFSPKTEFKKGEHHNIEVEYKKGQYNKFAYKKGEKHPLFNNYSSFEPYGLEFNNNLKEQIRQRDNYRCQQCFREEKELFNKKGKPRKLTIHHIDFNKKNNHPENLISLCFNCHNQTNYNREKWTNYFQNRLRGKL